MPRQPEELIFLSALFGRRARSKKLGTTMGRVHDAVATLTELYPQVRGLVLQHRETRVIYPATAAEYFAFHRSGVLVIDESRIEPHELGERDFSVRDLLWDKQIVDVDGAKVVRVNDVQLLVSEKQWVVHVDVGLSGLMRRLGFEGLARGAAKSVGKPLLDELISWKFVQPVSSDASALEPVRLTVGARKLNELHPGELADILEDLNSGQRQVILESLDTEIAAEAIQETDEDVQRAIFAGMSTELAADILEEMEPAKAADVLANLDEEASAAIIEAFEGEEEKADLQELLTYEDETAGALMSTDYLEINGDRTVGEALELVREAAGEIEAFYYVYVHDDDGRLVGALSLRGLLRTDPALQCGNVVQHSLVSLDITADIAEIASTFLRYNFLCLPVIDSGGVLRGVVSFKHSFDQLLPQIYKSWKAD